MSSLWADDAQPLQWPVRVCASRVYTAAWGTEGRVQPSLWVGHACLWHLSPQYLAALHREQVSRRVRWVGRDPQCAHSAVTVDSGLAQPRVTRPSLTA